MSCVLTPRPKTSLRLPVERFIEGSKFIRFVSAAPLKFSQFQIKDAPFFLNILVFPSRVAVILRVPENLTMLNLAFVLIGSLPYDITAEALCEILSPTFLLPTIVERFTVPILAFAPNSVVSSSVPAYFAMPHCFWLSGFSSTPNVEKFFLR